MLREQLINGLNNKGSLVFDSFSLMVHGGAGTLGNVKTDKDHLRYLDSIHAVLEFGRSILKNGGSAVQAVEACASLLEDDPVFNAGCGSVFNADGKVEMDAGIMDGSNLAAGAIAGVHNIANPIMLARKVLEESEHVLLIGNGAMRFAETQGISQMPDPYFSIPDRIKQYEHAKLKGKTMLDHDDDADTNTDEKYGTIGAVAKDIKGNLAAATSTGGIVYKQFGRVGDSPIIGSGVYADNETCAVSCTGFGEDFMRTVLAKSIADRLEFCGLSTEKVSDAVIEYFKNRIAGRGGFILIDKQGKCIRRFTTKKMIHGWIENGEQTECSFE